MRRHGTLGAPPSSPAGRRRTRTASGSPRSPSWLPTPAGRTQRRSPSGGVLDVEFLQVPDLRAIVHGEAVAEVEQVLVLDARVILNFPLVVIKVFQIERVDTVLIHRHHLANLILVLVLVLESSLMCPPARTMMSSVRLTETACTSVRISPGLGSGTETSSSRSTDAGPNSRIMAAFMNPLVSLPRSSRLWRMLVAVSD
jgi:hypothetical protein